MEREYIVTVRKDIDWRELHAEIIRDTTADDSVDSNVVPDRACECCSERPNNPRNTNYHLTKEEAQKLRNDPRVLAVQAQDEIPEPKPRAVQNGNFNRTRELRGFTGNINIAAFSILLKIPFTFHLLNKIKKYKYVIGLTFYFIIFNIINQKILINKRGSFFLPRL